MIEEAASKGELSQADYLRFSGEAATKRTDQVNRALQTIIPKFWELDAARGLKNDPKNRFYYPKFVVKPGSAASKLDIGDRMGGGISISRLGSSIEYAKASPDELKRLVDSIKQYCAEHPEADAAAIAKATLWPIQQSVASQELDRRLPFIINSLTPVKAQKKESK
jgi:hypothetical protein